MKKFLIVFLSSFLVLLLCCSIAGAELAKEGSGNYRSGRSAQLNVLKMGEKYMQINFDETGVVVDAPADSPFYNATFNTMGSIHAVKGIFTYSGSALWTRPNGEEIYGNFKGEGTLGAGSTTTVEIVGGEGECEGITGTMDLKSGPYAKTSKKGYSIGTSIGTVKWKIP